MSNWELPENTTCYVCEGPVVEPDLYCYKQLCENEPYSFRHLWHGVPGITYTVGTPAGVRGYAMTLEEAKARAAYYVNSNPYAAPEVKSAEQVILDEVNRLYEVTS